MTRGLWSCSARAMRSSFEHGTCAAFKTIVPSSTTKLYGAHERAAAGVKTNGGYGYGAARAAAGWPSRSPLLPPPLRRRRRRHNHTVAEHESKSLESGWRGGVVPDWPRPQYRRGVEEISSIFEHSRIDQRPACKTIR